MFSIIEFNVVFNSLFSSQPRLSAKLIDRKAKLLLQSVTRLPLNCNPDQGDL